MGNFRSWAACGACVVAACAPVSTSKRVIETPRPGTVRRDAPSQRTPELTLVVAAAGDGVELASVDHLMCVERRTTVVHRKELRHRHVNKAVTAIEYVLGIGLGAVGGYAAIAPDDAATHTGSADVAPADVRKAGIGVAALGGVFLISGVINSFRGGSSEHDLGEESRVAASGALVACGSAPRAGDSLALAAGGKRWPLGTTDAEGRLRVAWTAIPADVFAIAEWRTAQVTAGDGSAAKPVPIALDAAHDAAANRAWTAVVAAPTLDAVHAFLAQFPGTHDADAKLLLAGLADKAYGPPTAEAIARADVETARTSLTAWAAEAPDSPQRLASAQAFAQLEQLGAASYLYQRFEAAIADPTRLADADRTLAVFATTAPADPRLAAARALLAKRRAEGDRARLRNLQAHVEQARHFARHAELERAATELAAAKQLATAADDKLIAATTAYVDQYRAADEARRAAIAARAQAAAADKARREEAAAADKARREEAAAADKARREELAAKTAEEREQIAARTAAEQAARAQAAADARAARERAAAEAQAQREAAAKVAVDKAAADKARREQAAADAKARRDEAKLAAAQLAATEKPRRDEPARPRPTPITGDRTGMAGMWAASLGGGIWLLDLTADGSGRTAVWQAGRLVALRPVAWRLDSDALVLQVGSSAIRAPAARAGDDLTWSGLAWRRQ